MKYIELTVHTLTEASELVADVMWEYTTGGVALSDRRDIIALQSDKSVYWDYIDETAVPKESDVLVKCFFEPEDAGEKIPLVMRDIFARRDASGLNFGTLEDTRREIDGDDWIDVWKKHFRPIPVGNLVIVPEWIPYECKPHEHAVLLDSNMAFGTGEHETTSLLLELMQSRVKADDICIDVGCGSGILGIAAAKLGAKKCYLTDIDPIAVESATHNCKKNGVADRCEITQSDLLGEASVRADVVFANITAEILTRLAPSVPACLKEHGCVLLSGILTDRIDRVKEAYATQGLRVTEERVRGEWCALVLERSF